MDVEEIHGVILLGSLLGTLNMTNWMKSTVGNIHHCLRRALLAEVNTDVVLVMENAHYSSLCHAVVVEFLDAFDAEMC